MVENGTKGRTAMGINIKNPETCARIKALAANKGIGLTEAVDEAVRKELEWALGRKNLARDIKAITAKIRPNAHLIPASHEIDDLLYDEMGLPK
jgi:hypothetical protein